MPRCEDVRYEPVQCEVLGKMVWAIVMRAPDQGWRIVNCLDKEEGCFAVSCAFSTCGGEWPFALTTMQHD